MESSETNGKSLVFGSETVGIDKDLSIGILTDPHLTFTPPKSRRDFYIKSILRKIEYSLKTYDITICLGDLFSAPSPHTLVLNSLTRLLGHYIGRGKRFYLLPGNHDLYHDNYLFFDRTGVANLYYNERVRIVDGLTFCKGEKPVVSMQFLHLGTNFRELPKPIVADYRVLLGHAFLDLKNEALSIHSSDIESLGTGTSAYNLILLGHEHSECSPVQVGESVVLSMSSVARNSSHGYNLKRQPKMVVCRVDSKTLKVSVDLDVEIPAKKPSEVFHSYAFDVGAIESAEVMESNLLELFDAFSQVLKTQSSVDLRAALQQIGAPDEVVGYLSDFHTRNNLSFF